MSSIKLKEPVIHLEKVVSSNRDGAMLVFTVVVDHDVQLDN